MANIKFILLRQPDSKKGKHPIDKHFDMQDRKLVGDEIARIVYLETYLFI